MPLGALNSLGSLSRIDMGVGSILPPRHRPRGAGGKCVVAGAALFAMSLISMQIGPAKAAAPTPLVVDLYFDLAADSLAGLDVAAEDVAFGGDRMEIAGIPVRIDTAEGDVGWRTVAGARGSYTATLGHGLSFTGRANLANTDFVDAATADSAVGRAGGELRYAGGCSAGDADKILSDYLTSGDVYDENIVQIGRA